MDPNAAYKGMTEHLNAGDYSEAYDMASGLIRWLNMGGYPPKGISGQSALDKAWATRKACKPHIEV